MWISEIANKNMPSSLAENGKITIGGGSGEIMATSQNRNVNFYAPYGYSCCVPAGEDVLLIPISNGIAAAGTKSDSAGLQTGEVMIKSQSGAYIRLCADGSVVINSLKINSKGEIENDS